MDVLRGASAHHRGGCCRTPPDVGIPMIGTTTMDVVSTRSVLSLVAGRGDAGGCKIPTQMADVLLTTHSAVMRSMNHALTAIDDHMQTSAMGVGHVCTQMAEQRLHVPPMDIPPDGILKDFHQNASVFVTH